METNYKKILIWKNVTEKRRNDLLTNSDKFKDVKLIIKGSLNLEGYRSLTSLPDGLKVEGSLILARCTSLTSLPVGLKVGYHLNLEGCTNLTSLPDGLKVEGNLSLEGCTNLTSLPNGLKVEGGLDFANTPLAKYTDGELLKMIGSNGYINKEIKRKWLG